MIYLDHASATPLSKVARLAMEPYFSQLFFNPSATYLPAKAVRAEYEQAKNTIAHCIGAKGINLIITSGATEANNLAFSLVKKSCLFLTIEHESIVQIATQKNGIPIKVDSSGLINLQDFITHLNDQIELVSVSLANNEIGTIQPLAKIASIIQSERLRRIKQGITTPIYFHSDASQAMNLIDISVARLGVDLLTLNSAKVYGPKGVGALYVSHHVPLAPLFLGGGQEHGLRSGTENVPGVIGFASAFKEAKAHLNHNRQFFTHINNLFCTEISNHSIIPHFIGNVKNRLANFCPLSYPNLDAERLIYKLEAQSVYLSTGSACAARKGIPSRTLQAIGLSDTEITGSLRISFGVLNTESNVLKAAKFIKQAVSEETARHV